MASCKILLLVDDGFNDLELCYPFYRLVEEGYKSVVVAPILKPLKGLQSYTIEPDAALPSIKPEEYMGLIIPGGTSPISLRLYDKAKDTIRTITKLGRPIAAISTGPLLLLSAGVARGRRLTGYWGIRDDIENAGAVYVDQHVAVDGNIVTARSQDDLPFMMREFLRLLKEYII